MFTQRLAIKHDNKAALLFAAANIGRKLSMSVLRMVKGPGQSAAAFAAVPQCENGLCAITWKPQRPAA